MVQQWSAFECGCHILVNIVESALRPDLLCKSVVVVFNKFIILHLVFPFFVHVRKKMPFG